MIKHIPCCHLLKPDFKEFAGQQKEFMKWNNLFQYAMIMLASAMPLFGADDTAQAKVKKPNILVIMGDDVGWFNIGAYHRGIMSGKTPNLDKLASEGMLLLTTMPRPAAQQAARTSSPENFLYAPD